MNQVIQHLKNNSRNILLATHTAPDGDALGSLLALGLCLTSLGKQTILFNESAIPEIYRFLPSINRVVRNINDINNYDTAIILDCADLERVGRSSKEIYKNIPTIINIDHHITNTHFGDYQIVDTSASATSEIVYYIIKALDIQINFAVASAIYTGILTDTGSFQFANTKREAFGICAEMVELGVDPHFVAQNVYVTYTLGRIKLIQMVLDSIEVSENGRLSMMALSQDMLTKSGMKPDNIGRLINYARHIEDVRVAALIREGKPNENYNNDLKNFHVSLRSDGTFDVATIAESFGGGGHASAAGFDITSTLQNVKKTIMDLAEQL
ncbi:MAG: hypothetical protein HN737_12255 [Desulfobacterales bacterium]|jgi:bifunctional oligoribonuclease and PAP phosphatase NrnA|nr:hypothetical protein [Desulfobacteraceae bacterium]MBT7086120.1 hypothetical protein [Desulfobacterales bacterium]MBT7698170.1 hypothetical protein [Desulfobacterales bacterium]